MSIRVSHTVGDDATYDTADSWEAVETPTGPRLDVFKKGADPNLNKVVGCYAPGHWSKVAAVAKEDKAALLARAVELIGDVDDGNFGHQSTEWQNKAEQFLTDVAT